MNIVKSLVLSGLVLVTTPVIKQNEIVIPTGEAVNSICEVSYHVYERCELENNVTISWDMNDTQSKHFSIERYVEGDINDAFIISKNKHEQDGFEWWTLDIEGWRNVDENWFEFSMGL
jgi:hypothetical protein